MKTKIIYIGLSLLLFLFSLLFLLEADEEKSVSNVTTKAIQKVSIVSREVKSHSAYMYVNTQLRFKDIKTVHALVEGEITFTSNKLLEGRFVNQGEIMVVVDSSLYKVALYEAKYKLFEAEYELSKQEKKHLQATRDWNKIESNPNDKISDLALNLPQLNLAKANLALAKSSLKHAQKMLNSTTIKAPISGYITRKLIHNATHINQSDELFEISSNEKMVAKIDLSSKQWNMLADEWRGSKVEIQSLSTNSNALATLVYGGDYMRKNLYRLYLEVQDTNLLVGDFIQIKLPTKTIENSIKIPTNAISDNALVWYVDEDNMLQNFKSEKTFYNSDSVLLSIANDKINQKKWKIVPMPLSTFFKGMAVFPIELEVSK